MRYGSPLAASEQYWPTSCARSDNHRIAVGAPDKDKHTNLNILDRDKTTALARF